MQSDATQHSEEQTRLPDPQQAHGQVPALSRQTRDALAPLVDDLNVRFAAPHEMLPTRRALRPRRPLLDGCVCETRQLLPQAVTAVFRGQPPLKTERVESHLGVARIESELSSDSEAGRARLLSHHSDEPLVQNFKISRHDDKGLIPRRQTPRVGD